LAATGVIAMTSTIVETTQQSRQTPIDRGLRWSLAMILVVSVAVLAYGTVAAQRAAPPVPDEVVSTDGTSLFTRGDILDGRAAFLRGGLMDFGSLYGNGSYLRATRHGLVHPALDPPRGLLGDHRTHVGSSGPLVTHDDLRCGCDQRRDKRREQLTLHVDALHAEAVLAGVGERTAGDGGNGQLQIGVGAHDHRAVCAKLHDHPFQASRPSDHLSVRSSTGEPHHPGVVVRHERLAYLDVSGEHLEPM
jgi:hypothetical protein